MLVLSFQDEDDTYDCEIDLDELLDLDEERERWMFVQASVNRLQTIIDV